MQTERKIKTTIMLHKAAHERLVDFRAKLIKDGCPRSLAREGELISRIVMALPADVTLALLQQADE